MLSQSTKSASVGRYRCFVVGVLIGLIILGWWLWPVKWTNASPEQLQKDYQADYVRMAIDSYIKTQDAPTAKARLNTWERKPLTRWQWVKSDPLKLKAERITALKRRPRPLRQQPLKKRKKAASRSGSY